MSEYQYYEFLAIDRPLTADEIAELRALSTRAVVTPVSFTNEYNWGNFGGDPYELMQDYFDAHVYVANWMTATFMVRLPIDALTRETVMAFTVPYSPDIKSVGIHWIITWELEESVNYDRFGMEDGAGWMARLSPVREELLRGDLRSLYIGWLAAMTDEKMGNDEMEPLSVNGLGNLTAAQQALAEFLEVDQDLLDGNGREAERNIRKRFTSWRADSRENDSTVSRRTLGELRQNADTARQLRLEQQERDRKQREIERRKKRTAYLKYLSDDFSRAWASAKEPVERGSGRGYDEARRILVDISEAYDLFATKQQFQDELRRFMAGYLRRKAFVQRLVNAGIWYEE